MSEFDQQIAVQPAGDGEFKADLAPGWVVGGGVNGGYLLAVIGNAIRASLTDKPDPIAISAYYLAAAEPGPVTVTTRTLREGRTVA
ncbi:MAG TPA: acyl-CoA thioesterase domain-containing protein, partial [Nocardioides sp.]|nr:acyl-CoA thioesterase domain-containing protein [Nocardioides sp.]